MESNRFNQGGRKSVVFGAAALFVVLAIAGIMFAGCDSKSDSDGDNEADSGGYFGGLTAAQLRAKMTASKANMKAIGAALRIYASEFDYRYPESPDLLVSDGLIGSDILATPMDGKTPYVFIAPSVYRELGRMVEDDADAIVVYDPHVVDGGVMVVPGSGAVKTMPVEEFKKELFKIGIDDCKLIEK